MPGKVVLTALAAALALSGCGLNEGGGSGSRPPRISAKGTDTKASQELGFPVAATKNTTRVPGADATADVAGVVSAVFPGTNASNRPHAVAIVDKDNWPAAVAAGVLMARPLQVPILVSDGGKLPAVSSDTLDRLSPRGAPLAKSAQVIRVGQDAARPKGYRSAIVPGKDPYKLAAAIDRFFSAARGRPAPDVVVASAQRADYAMPAAAWAARSGDSVLYASRDSLPPATRTAIQQHSQPNIYILGPPSVIGPGVQKQLSKLGRVRRIQAPTPVQNAIAFTRFGGKGGFGWGITTPGQNFTLATTDRPLDAAAAAVLGTSGVFAPLLLTDDAKQLPHSLEGYFLDVQPGFEDNPNAGVFNHVWILGDDKTVSVAVQGRLDQITELIPVQIHKP